MTFIYEAAKLFNQHFGHEFDDESLKVAAEKVLSFEKELTLVRKGTKAKRKITYFP